MLSLTFVSHERKMWWGVVLLGSIISGSGEVRAHVPAMFVFGDSLVDPGNNNNLVTLAKADYSPYGIDFPVGVTGRYCNGGTVADHLGNLLGFQLIPPFNNPNTTGSNMLKGVNFGSAASGILDDTGKLYGELFSMGEQIQNFRKSLQELDSLMGDGVENFLGRSLFFVCTGNNDYLNNYLLPFSINRNKYTPEAYHQLLVQQFSSQLKELYDLGARKFVIAGLGPLGCIPNQIGNGNGNTSSCVTSTNELAAGFNSILKTMLDGHNTALTGSYFLYWDAYSSTSDIINNYSKYGFKYQHKACCGGGRSKGQIMCLPLLPFECKNRSDFVFWDAYHSTDAFNVIAAKHAFQGTLQASFPQNVQQLIQS